MWTLFYSISGTHKVKPYLELRIRKRKYIAQITEAVEHSLKDVLPLFYRVMHHPFSWQELSLYRIAISECQETRMDHLRMLFLKGCNTWQYQKTKHEEITQ